MSDVDAFTAYTVEVVDRYRVLRALEVSDPQREVEPGVLAGEALAIMTAEEPPAGVRYVDHQVVGTAGAGGNDLPMHLFAQPVGAAAPGLLFVHGGGFQEGYPEMMLRYANHLAAHGWVTAVCTYRLSGDAPWPACLEDVKCAARWLRANADTIGLDADRFGVVGSSAGGTLAALLAATAGRFEGEGGNAGVPSNVHAAMLMYPALELRPGKCNPAVNPLLDRLFRGRDTDSRSDASPMVHVAAMPPVLTVVGDRDPVVPLDQVVAFHGRLDELGVENDHVVIVGGGHSLDYSFARWDENFDRMRSWFTRQLGAPGAVRPEA